MNTITDHTTQLHNDFIPREKTHYYHNRRRFNPGNPNEFEFVPAPIPMRTTEEKMVAANVDDNGAALHTTGDTATPESDRMPSNEHIF